MRYPSKRDIYINYTLLLGMIFYITSSGVSESLFESLVSSVWLEGVALGSDTVAETSWGAQTACLQYLAGSLLSVLANGIASIADLRDSWDPSQVVMLQCYRQ